MAILWLCHEVLMIFLYNELPQVEHLKEQDIKQKRNHSSSPPNNASQSWTFIFKGTFLIIWFVRF